MCRSLIPNFNQLEKQIWKVQVKNSFTSLRKLWLSPKSSRNYELLIGIVSISSILNFTQIAHDILNVIRLFSTLSLSRFYEPESCSTAIFGKNILFILLSAVSYLKRVISFLPAFSFFSFQFGTARNSVMRYALITGASAILPVCETYTRHFLVGTSTDKILACSDSTTNRLLHT
jgi:hypothetical protein